METQRDMFHFRRAAFSAQIKAKVGRTLVKTATLRINLNIDGTPITLTTQTHPSHSQTSRLLDSSVLDFSLSSHQHSYIGLVFTSRFID